MLSLPPYIPLLGAFIGWIGLAISWSRHIREVSEQRRLEAAAHGEAAPDIKGASNYERAALRDSAHRALKVTTREKWIGKGVYVGVPILILIVFFINAPL